MAATKIMIIRHAERPSDDGSIDGVNMSGTKDPEELTVRGWQRAGALVRFFAPANGHFVNAQLATPDTIFASKVAHHSPSLRPQHTVMLLADFCTSRSCKPTSKVKRVRSPPMRSPPMERCSSHGCTRRFRS
jgi:hypothetical protein